MNRFWKNKRVLVTGGSGFVGKHIIAQLEQLQPAEINAPPSSKFDLRIVSDCRSVVRNMDVIIHLAANVGGIGYNQKYPGTLFYDNLLMGANLMEEARLAKVGKFVAIGTICSYPKLTPIPFQEKNLWDGYPEETNAPYGLAKKMMLVQSQAYRDQYDYNSIYLLPVNMYGPGDNFDPSSSHVIPALIKKFIDAKNNNTPKVVIWGTGKPTREFLYVEDAATGILKAAAKYNKSDPVNLGSSFEISIADLAKVIMDMTKFTGKLTFDSSKPDGQPRRKLDISRAKKEFGFVAKTTFRDGLRKTIDWYLKHLR